MKHLLLLALLLAGADPQQAAIPYFTNVRDVSIAAPGKQNYFVVDPEIWTHARPDLGDLRLFDDASPVQYAISEQRASVSSNQVQARVLNLGRVSGHTELDLDCGNLAEYDRVQLKIEAKDFIVTASVSGGNTPGASASALTSSTVYDFSREQLGSNLILKLPPTTYRYLHVKLSKGIGPEQIKGAALYNLREQKAVWTQAGSCSEPRQEKNTTIIVCDVPAKVPLDRLELQIAPQQVNFLRTVRVEDAKGLPLGSGEISRVRINRNGSAVTDEKLAIHLSSASGTVTLKIDNGDNPPLSIITVRPLSVERRVYFDPQGRAAIRLYYGDEKLPAPAYDYARFFRVEDSSAQAQLSPGTHNSLFTGRPDERPWSDRHKVILRTAMLVAVLGLSVLAIRGLRP